MCEYYGGYQDISDKEVTTRVEHECSSCLTHFPAKSRMRRWAGLSEGEFCAGYVCQVCDFANMQKDETPLHLCYGWAWDGGYDARHDRQVWDYIAHCLGNNETPTVTGLEAALAQHMALEDA